MSDVTPEQEDLLRQRAQALGKAYFVQPSKDRSSGEAQAVTDGAAACRRHLQGPLLGLNLTAPTRRCGDIIADLTVDDLQTIGNALIQAVLPLGIVAEFGSLLLNTTTINY